MHKSRNRDDFQDVPGYVGAMAKHFPRGYVNPLHAHKRAQLIYAISGVMEVSTSDHHWLLPPQRALWMPAQVGHEMRARTDVELRTLFVRISDVDRPLPEAPALVYVTPLLRELILRAVDLPIEEGASGAAAQVLSLIFSEMRFVLPTEFYMPRVSDPRLIRVEEALRHEPGSRESIEHWASLANMSVRTFARRIKDETTLSFTDWRQQIRLTEAVVGLVAGEPVTTIALSLGYENTGSFSRMFKRVMGISPSELSTA
ncbi:AraC family transcriptional regulator [Paraburkholderia caballeronis]|uniref:AraC family transcriptional regulator n=1 Tax=Paraburkholderia caballeronis TaxID=416943 RepID=UPI0010E7333A|nr:helix-turn-helix transcriptional regulator [Paraburkholderia caballeronis]TDV20853.1 AraC family transcriptional regulator [Paraburkholderia caballeronis]TDV21282.1 AraC family transcriptional regulator [Paraburkholderia caballeronis]TDV33321.1 AraC family transcriptional regulator [Paraburkholderia caballeronis]